MGLYPEKTSSFFTRLASGLSRKHRPATVPLSMSLASPTPQTSFSMCSRVGSLGQMLIHPTFTVFKLPDELILSILSHIAPDPQLTSDYARFRIQYTRGIGGRYHQQRVRFLRPLSMTCKAMRLRLLPLMWERLDVRQSSWKNFVRELDAIVDGLRCADIFLATSVRYSYAPLSSWIRANSRPLKVHDDTSPMQRGHPSFVRRMLGVPSMSSHARDRVDGRVRCGSSQGRT